jgi:hypothetical protein
VVACGIGGALRSGFGDSFLSGGAMV